MKLNLIEWSSAFLFLGFTISASAQTPSDAIMMSNGQVCLFAVYSHDSWDEYWEGTLLRSNGNVGTLTRQTITPGFALGLGDKLNVIATLPWVKTESSGGYIAGESGIQDWGLWLKGTALSLFPGPGNLTLHATAGIMGPASNYSEDYGPYSLGLGCLDFSMRGILQYRLDMGAYLRGYAAYQLRGNATIERDYYYTTHGVYSEEVNMPDAITYGVVLGSYLFNNSLRIELSYEGLNTQGGFDIRRQDVGFPSNQMNNTRVGGFAQYFLGNTGLGFIASAGQVLTGRNVGKSTMFSGGITYQFGLWKEKAPEETTE